MGVEEERGRNALRATGNVDSALLWLLKDDDNKTRANGSSEVERSSSGESKADSEGSSANGADETNDCCAEDAYDFLERELGHALSNDSKETLEKEWLGVDLKEEWEMIEEYK
mmetsp:Transcript_17643/g.26346  ORF Transcript_17643/g.26346 Transcript_17643/m.26346 type:complete len:113 (+) Transcript_17643:1-339(+)